jgi:hypothetical protein
MTGPELWILHDELKMRVLRQMPAHLIGAMSDDKRRAHRLER